MTQTLPRLLDQKSLARELGVAMHTARRIMQDLPQLKVGRRIYVSADAVADYLSKAAKS